MEHFKPARYLMIFCGIWRMHLYDSPTAKKMYLLYFMFIQCYYYSAQSLILGCLNCGAIYPDSVNTNQFKTCIKKLSHFFKAVAMHRYLGFTFVTAILKDTYIAILILVGIVKIKIFQGKNFIKIIQHIYSVEKEYNQNENEEINRIYFGIVRRTKWMSIVLLMYSIACGITLNGTCYLMYMKIRDEYVGKVAQNATFSFPSDVFLPTPLTVWRPYDLASHYHVAFFQDLVYTSIGCLMNTMTQLALLCTITFEDGELRILKFKFSELKRSSLEEDALVELIKKHHSIIRYIESLNKEVNMALLLEFTILSVQIATMLYDFIRTRDITIVFKITYTSLIIIQTFLLAWSANEIKEQSSEIATAVYESDWYNMDNSVKKCLIIIIIRAQRPSTLSVGPFFTLTNDTAVTSLKAGYSYMTVMNGK